jgi:hypothetical protein
MIPVFEVSKTVSVLNHAATGTRNDDDDDDDNNNKT